MSKRDRKGDTSDSLLVTLAVTIPDNSTGRAFASRTQVCKSVPTASSDLP